MAKNDIVLINEERPFSVEELFFSLTDTKGKIYFGNDVFTRISAYEEGELIDAPHNIVRHPDMPRAVFRLLWNYIGAGRPIAAYVKNLAKDGRYYWVLAAVMPCHDGYLSIRLKPTSPLFQTAQAIYREALALEKKVENDTGNRNHAMDAATTLIVEKIKENGFESYDSFMSQALASEMQHRKGKLSRNTVMPAPSMAEGTNHEIRRLASECNHVSRLLEQLFQSIESFRQLDSDLVDKSSCLKEIAATLQFESLNAKIAAGKIPGDGSVLAAVSKELGIASTDTENLIRELVERMKPLGSSVSQLVFETLLADIEAEVCSLFARELAAKGQAEHSERVSTSLSKLLGEMTERSKMVVSDLQALQADLMALSPVAEAVNNRISEMQAVQFAGKKEAMTQNQFASFRNIFSEVGARIAQGRCDCEQLRDTIDMCISQSGKFLKSVPELKDNLRTISELGSYVGGRQKAAKAAV